ncbi:hypothetical protein [uncultured Methylobacterium sp.]|jgi:hypothetical protein|uniref:hypothetical protein n=1 Tax=uncultured Methylobacterium sp. TaxID=157278 RepID=UPI0026152B4C|nr:hypothetical protein [uncultured Methylobacterium sp.]
MPQIKCDYIDGDVTGVCAMAVTDADHRIINIYQVLIGSYKVRGKIASNAALFGGRPQLQDVAALNMPDVLRYAQNNDMKTASGLLSWMLDGAHNRNVFVFVDEGGQLSDMGVRQIEIAAVDEAVRAIDDFAARRMGDQVFSYG